MFYREEPGLKERFTNTSDIHVRNFSITAGMSHNGRVSYIERDEESYIYIKGRKLPLTNIALLSDLQGRHRRFL